MNRWPSIVDALLSVIISVSGNRHRHDFALLVKLDCWFRPEVLASAPMRQMIILFGLLVALLATSLHTDGAAHPVNTRFACMDQAFETNGDQDGTDHKGQAGSGVVHHHHCPNVATPSASAELKPVSLIIPMFPDGIHRALASVSLAPPIDPPSA